jgi:hypothetical protein
LQKTLGGETIVLIARHIAGESEIAAMIARKAKKPHNQENLTPPVVSKLYDSAQYRSVLAELRAGIKSTKCNRLIKLLESLGYEVRAGSSGKHYVFAHPQMKRGGFHGGDFNCGHGKNPNPLPVYIKNTIKTLESHAEFFDPHKPEEDDNGV